MIPAIAERIDAIGLLLISRRAEDSSYRKWLEQRLLFWNARYSEFVHLLMPDSYWTWSERLAMVEKAISGIIPVSNKLILVDANQWGSEIFENYQVIPYLERDGTYWGPPPDDETAVEELERLRTTGAAFVVIGWPAFWWLEHYSGFSDHLQTQYPCIFRDSRLLVYYLGDVQR